jgi:hypothetical protein
MQARCYSIWFRHYQQWKKGVACLLANKLFKARRNPWYVTIFWWAVLVLICAGLLKSVWIFSPYRVRKALSISWNFNFDDIITIIFFAGFIMLLFSATFAIEKAQPDRSPYFIWFTRSLIVLLIGLVLCIFRDYLFDRPIPISIEVPHPWYDFLDVPLRLLSAGTIFVGSVTAFISACTALVKQIQNLRKALRPPRTSTRLTKKPS